MKRFSLLLLLLSAILMPTSVWAAMEEFYIQDIRVDGLQRVPARTVFSALPVNVGDKLSQLRITQSLKRLFKTGNFQDVQIGRDGDVLVIVVKERPSINTIEIEGNKGIETEALLKGMKQSGLEEGEVFKRNVLEHMRQELKRLYIAQGRYGATIESIVTDEDINRVSLKIVIDEGDVASIRQVTVVGNEVFAEQELLDQFELKKAHFTTFYKKDNRYAREKLQGDIESLRSFYMDRGYINVEVQSTQVSVTPDKEKVYVTVNVVEGEEYTVNSVKLAGRLVVPESELKSLIVVREGKTFSHRDLTLTNELISKYIGNEGYMFARVNGIPEINEENKTVDITFFIDPGKRTYIRRINFSGNEKTEDSVLRREMRQMEGAWVSTAKVERSKRRLDRLGYFNGVKVETVRVPGEPDQVDVNYVVEEGTFGEIGASVSYQPSIGAAVNLYHKENNFFGSGNSVTFNFERSSFRDSVSFSFVDPYYTIDGVRRGVNAYYTTTDLSKATGSSSTSSATDTRGIDLTFGYPISEIETLNFAVGVKQTRIHSNLPSGIKILEQNQFFLEEGKSLDVLNLSAGYLRSTLDRAPFATSGSEQRLNLLVTAPKISDLEFFTTSFKNDYYIPLIGHEWIFHSNLDIAYGAGYGSTTKLPYFENFYAGGIGSVRGFRQSSLGYKSHIYRPTAQTTTVNGAAVGVTDENGNPVYIEYYDANGKQIFPEGPQLTEYRNFGGNLKTETTAELIVPTPFVKDRRMLRSSIFFDAGNVFDTARGFSPSISQLRYSMGASLTWVTAIAPLTFVYAVPIGEKNGDSTKRFEFQLGSSF